MDNHNLAALEARYCERVLSWAQSTAHDLFHSPQRERAAYIGVKEAWEAWKAEHRRIHGA